MHRIDTPTAQVDKFGAGKNGFTGGNPQTGELPTALDADFFDSIQEELSNVIEGAGIVLKKSERNQLLKALTALTPGRLLNVKVFTSSGTYTPTPGTKKILIELVGGGGGGGYASPSTVGSGGGAGGFVRKLMEAPSSQNFTVGQAGTAGTSTVAATPGGSTVFGSLIAGGGGQGSFNSGAAGGGGSASGGDLNIAGTTGCGGITVGGVNMGGYGGTVPGYGAPNGGYVLSLSITSTGYGAGGGGGANGNSGAPGRPGIIYIMEYA